MIGENNFEIPEQLPISIVFQKSLPILGTQSADIDSLDTTYLASQSQFRKDASEFHTEKVEGGKNFGHI